jgi:hypothetical protein
MFLPQASLHCLLFNVRPSPSVHLRGIKVALCFRPSLQAA